VRGFQDAPTSTRSATTTTGLTKASGTFRVPPENASQTISSRLWNVLRGARSRPRRSSLKSSCRRSAHGASTPNTQRSTTFSSSTPLAPLETARRISRRAKIPKMRTKKINLRQPSSRMPPKPSMLSLVVRKIFVPSANRSCCYGKFYPSSRRYHDHSDGRRSPYHFLVLTSGPAFPSLGSFH
jgi:hypothetical protein